MAGGCYNIQSLHSHRQTHTGTMKSFALVLGRCDISYVMGQAFPRVQISDAVIASYQQWPINDLLCDALNWNLEECEQDDFSFIWYFLSCIINVSCSKSWTLRSQKMIVIQSAHNLECELFSHHLCSEIFLGLSLWEKVHTTVFSSQCHKPHHCW